MNVFYTDTDPIIAANNLNDKHIIKMCLETAQILSTVSHRYGVTAPYKPTHSKHPCVLWAGESKEHWTWLVRHGLAIGNEYRRRYDKEHKSVKVIQWCDKQGGRPPSKGWNSPPACMPNQFKYNLNDFWKDVQESARAVKGPAWLKAGITLNSNVFETFNSKINIKNLNITKSYRTYYQKDKASFATWRTQPPTWWTGKVIQCTRCALWASVEATAKWQNNKCTSCKKFNYVYTA